MSTDYSRKRFKPENDFRRVLVEQGRVQSDADTNEHRDVQDRRTRAGTVDLVGRCGVPSQTPDGFKVELPGGEITVGAGRIYVDGILAENHGFTREQLLERLESNDDVVGAPVVGAPVGGAPVGAPVGAADPTLEFDPVLEEERAQGPVAYAEQPYHRHAASERIDAAAAGTDMEVWEAPDVLPAGPGTHLVYVDVWERELDFRHRPSLIEPAIGVETSARAQTVWQVRVLPDVGDVNCADALIGLNGWLAANARSDGRLTSGPVAGDTDPDPCRIPPRAQYKGEENHLYRVEVHRGGTATGDDTGATFKWSRDNAIVASEVTAVPSSSRVTVASMGRDDYLSFAIGDWVEVTDEVRQLHGVPGVIAKIADILPGRTLDLTVNGGDDLQDVLFAPAGAVDVSRRPRVIRWDHSGEVRDPDDNVFYDLDDAATIGVIPIPNDGTAIVLEHGVQVVLETDPGGAYRVGDYWVFAVRTADASVERLNRAPPEGIHHHYCALALIHDTDGTPEGTYVTDCRPIFPRAGCCCIDVRPGQDIQAAIDRLPPEGGHVSLLVGVHRLRAGLRIAGRENITISGCGHGSWVVYDPVGEVAAPPITIARSRDIVLTGFTLMAQEVGHVVVLDGGSHRLRVDDMVVMNVHTLAEDEDAPTRRSCVLLGDCFGVSITGSRLFGPIGVLQANASNLGEVREPIPDPLGEFPLPPDTDVGPISDISIVSNRLHTIQEGVFLLDAVDGTIAGNRLEGVSPELVTAMLEAFEQAIDTGDADAAADEGEPGVALGGEEGAGAGAEEAGAGAEGAGAGAEAAAAGDGAAGGRSRLASLNLTEFNGMDLEKATADFDRDLAASSAGENLPAGAAIRAALLQSFDIDDNHLRRGQGLTCSYARGVRARRNRVRASTAGISFGYGFDLDVRENKLLLPPGGFEPFDRGVDPFEGTDDVGAALRALPNILRPPEGNSAISLSFARGARIVDNEFVAATGISSTETRTPLHADVVGPSLIRVLGIERLWNLTMQLFWILRQLIALLSKLQEGDEEAGEAGDEEAGGAGDEAAEGGGDGAGDTREEFEASMLAGFAEFLEESVPSFLGKVRVVGNDLRADVIGVRFDQVLTVGGIVADGNRVTGAAHTGIRIHPLYSVGLPDTFACWLRCIFEFLHEILCGVRDGLTRWIDGGEGAEAPGGEPSDATLGATIIAGFISLCGQVSAAEGGGDGGVGEAGTIVEKVRDAVAALLDVFSKSWVDDFLGQSYSVSKNVVRGSGTGIWVGIDGAAVEQNQVTVDPLNTVPYESIAFGAALNGRAGGSSPGALAQSLTDLDQESLFLMTGLAMLTGSRSDIDVDVLDSVDPFVDADSRVRGPLEDLRTALEDESDDADFHLIRLLFAIWAGLRGYGIVLVGGDIRCDGNRVVSERECSDFEPDPDSGGAKRPAVGGIWHFTNLGLWLQDLVVLLADLFADLVADEPAVGGVADEDDGPDLIPLLLAILAILPLVLTDERSLRISRSTVEGALSQGLRARTVQGLTSVDLMQNEIRDAARIGLRFLAGGLLEGGDHFGTMSGAVRVRDNSVIRSEDVYAFQELLKLDAVLSPSLVRLMEVTNQSVPTGWHALVTDNHAVGNAMSQATAAVRIDTRVANVADNHVVADVAPAGAAAVACEVEAFQGNFANNLTRPGTNRLSGVVESGTISLTI